MVDIEIPLLLASLPCNKTFQLNASGKSMKDPPMHPGHQASQNLLKYKQPWSPGGLLRVSKEDTRPTSLCPRTVLAEPSLALLRPLGTSSGIYSSETHPHHPLPPLQAFPCARVPTPSRRPPAGLSPLRGRF